MKAFILLLVTLLSIEAKAQNQLLTGSWTASGPDWVFDLTIIHEGTKVSGNHCSVTRNGNRIDCSNDDADMSFTGTSNTTPVVTVTFKSHYSASQGKATIKRINDSTIEWRIIQEPKGEYHLPAFATLSKTTSTELKSTDN
jgi:hypothetical protein